MGTVTASQWSQHTPTPTPTSALSRIERHALAAEILRVRTGLILAWAIWMLGIGFDLVTRAAIGGGPLWLILTARLGSCAFLAGVGWHLYRGGLETPRLTRALIVLMFPVTALAQTILAAALGGLTSPYVTGMFILLICEAGVVTMPWKRALALTLATTSMYPAGMLIGCALSPELAAQLADDHTRNVFILETLVLLGAGDIATWVSHAMWRMRKELSESRSVGRYRLLSRIGRGGMGEVWRATDRATRREVALKLLVPRFEGDDPRAVRAAVERFEREIAATVRLDHPHVVRILDWGATDDGIWYYAMEILDGADLARLVEERGPLAPPLAVRLALQAAQALGAAHRAGIVHRDVKPANLFVVRCADGADVKVLDFGVARVEDDPGLTRSGALVGTPSFMPPEVLAGRPADAHSDVWALAATLRFALTGRPPREAIAGGDPAIPQELASILDAALAAEPSARPTDGSALAAALAATSLATTPAGAALLPPPGEPTTAPADAQAPTVPLR